MRRPVRSFQSTLNLFRVRTFLRVHFFFLWKKHCHFLPKTNNRSIFRLHLPKRTITMSTLGKGGSAVQNSTANADKLLKEGGERRRLYTPEEKALIIEKAMSKPGCRRLCRRANVKRIDKSVYPLLRDFAVEDLSNLMRVVIAHVNVCDRKTITKKDVRDGAKQRRLLVIGYGEPTKKSSKSGHRASEKAEKQNE